MTSRISAILMAAAGVGLGVGVDAGAGAAVIAEWTFETSQPTLSNSPAITGIVPEVGVGNASGVHQSAETDYSSPAGNGSVESFSANNWTDGDYFEFQTSTLGLQDVVVTFDQTRSSTGPATFDFQYSTDGTTFVTALDNYTVLSSSTVSAEDATESNPERNFWSVGNGRQAVYTYEVDLSAVSVLEDDDSVFFRLVDDTGLTSATGGTSRVDNFQVSAVPEPGTLALVGVAGLLALRRRRR